MSAISRQRLTHGLQMNASYTWSHTLDVTTDSNGGGTPLIPYDGRTITATPIWDFGTASWRAFVYDIPFFHVGNRF